MARSTNRGASDILLDGKGRESVCLPVFSHVHSSRCTDPFNSPYREALKTLSGLGILPNSKGELIINPAFKQGLREGLTGGCVSDLFIGNDDGGSLTKGTYSGSNESFGVPAPDDENRPPIGIEQLNVYALERWEVSGGPVFLGLTPLAMLSMI